MEVALHLSFAISVVAAVSSNTNTSPSLSCIESKTKQRLTSRRLGEHRLDKLNVQLNLTGIFPRHPWPRQRCEQTWDTLCDSYGARAGGLSSEFRGLMRGCHCARNVIAVGSKSALYQDESRVEGKGRQYPTLCSSSRSSGSENCARHYSGIEIC